MMNRRSTLSLSLKLLVRDWKAGELTVLIGALLIAVSALTAVAFLTDRVGQAVEMRAAESLAADLRVASAISITPEFISLAQNAGLSTAEKLELMVQGSLDGYVAAQQEDVNALGEEVGDIFDVDIGF